MSDNDRLECVRSLLEDSQLDRHWRGLIEATLRRIPLKDLEYVWNEQLLDHFVILYEKDRAITIDVLWQCMAKHDVHVEMLNIGDGEEKPIEVIESIKRRKWLIILNEVEMKKLDRESQMSVLAEEFAHVFLKHSRLGTDGTVSVNSEEEADAIITRWGFRKIRQARS